MRILLLLLAMPFLSNSATASRFEKVSEKGNRESWVFRQSVSHEAGSSATFRQRLFLDRAFAQGPASPILLEICAEWECTSWPSDLAAKAAKAAGALVVKVEHRFYGESHPFAELTVENLRLLTTRHALLDLEAVIEGLRSELGLSGPLVALGCSHAGSLAAYLRSRRPDLVEGAVAVSAPVRAQALVPEKDAFNAGFFAGSCADTLRRNMAAFESRMLSLDEEGFRQALVKHRFTRSDVSRLSFFDILGDFPGKLVTQDDYRVFCKEIRDDSLEPFEYWFGRFVWLYGPEKESFEVAEEESVAKIGSGATIRQWLYQTCSEYGYFQVSDPERGVGPRSKSAASKLAMCSRLFGIRALPDTDAFNRAYHDPLVASGSRVLFANARHDFWWQLSVTPENNRNPLLSTVMAEKGGHCSALRDFARDGTPGPQAGAALRAVQEWWAPAQ